MRARTWVFTLNNPQALLSPQFYDGCTFCVYSEEMGANGTHHFQGYIEFSRPFTLNMLKRVGAGELRRAHFEKRNGTRKQAIDYATKEDETHLAGPYWWPRNPDGGGVVGQGHQGGGGQGNRSDLKRLFTATKSGLTNAQICDDEELGVSLMKYPRGVDVVRLATAPARRLPDVPTVIWIIGPPGTGKTHFAQQTYPEPEAFWFQQNRWWDGYMGQKTVVLNEFNPSLISFKRLLDLLDRTPYRPESKGGHVNVIADTFIFTSNVHPKRMYENVPVHYPDWDNSPLRSRVTEWRYMLEVYRGEGARRPGIDPLLYEGPPRLAPVLGVPAERPEHIRVEQRPGERFAHIEEVDEDADLQRDLEFLLPPKFV
nr:rep protein [Cressdnaviricota sp.]UOF82985.1 rep protein [Cressdnaviricota sp.]